jgi:beta-lactam-binding protein with PASTA domain
VSESVSKVETLADATPARAWPIVPNVVGLGLAEACEAVAWAGGSVSATSVVRTRGPYGWVVAQTPAPGTQLKAMWQVHVLVSVPSSSDVRGDV